MDGSWDDSMSKWSEDAFLDGLRAQGDVLADVHVAKLKTPGDFQALFRSMNSNDAPLPPDAPPPLREFFEQTHGVPPGLDKARLERGSKVFIDYALPAALALLVKSLPEGYAAPNLSRILTISGDLDRHPYRRLLGVLQMLVNVTSPRAFEPQGKAIVTAQKMRLLHAGMRQLVPKYRPDYSARFGVPVNLEDMLGTIMGFSYLVIEGLTELRVPLSPEQAEDYLYLWRTFAQLAGIHPPGQPESTEFLPLDVAEAREFYTAYARRHYVPANMNPDGVLLAKDNLQMLVDLMPWVLRILGLDRLIPLIYMQDLIGTEGCQRVGIEPVRGHALLRHLLIRLPSLILKPWQFLAPEGKHHQNLATLLFQGMINQQYGGEVTFLIPRTLEDARKLAPAPSETDDRMKRVS